MRATGATAVLGAIVEMRVRGIPLSPGFYCRVIHVVEEPRCRGFTYGTLPGHPESGVETFVVEQRADGTVVLSIDAVSAPSNALWRGVGPLLAAVQSVITTRFYLRALD